MTLGSCDALHLCHGEVQTAEVSCRCQPPPTGLSRRLFLRWEPTLPQTAISTPPTPSSTCTSCISAYTQLKRLLHVSVKHEAHLQIHSHIISNPQKIIIRKVWPVDLDFNPRMGSSRSGGKVEDKL